ncbi:MAG: arsenical pump rane protein [Solirubrobacteraceae bacterium]|nr:arsenical pump rane protein [Solirubrobacteraceae bacterium]
MPDAISLILALLLLALRLAAAIAESRWASEAVIAVLGAGLLVAVGALSPSQAWDALGDLAPTAAFLAALLVLAEGCRRAGLFDALGTWLASGSRGSPSRLLGLVFAVAAAVTAVLSLDATVLLLTPVVLATAMRLRTSPRPHVYASAHLANSASLLLPVSNLTNLLAFHASGLSFARFAALMAAPWAGVLAVEWVVLRRMFRAELRRAAHRPDVEREPLPRFAVAVLALTLAGFCLSSLVGVDPLWVAVAGALALTLRVRARPDAVVRAAAPGFVAFVLGLGVIVAAAAEHGLGDAVDALLPAGESLPALLLVAAVSAVLANLVNNLPATLVLVPAAAAAGGEGAVLAVLVGVNVGPNLTYTGSLATLLWRRVLREEDEGSSLSEFVRLGLLTVPVGVAVAVALLWLGLQVGG